MNGVLKHISLFVLTLISFCAFSQVQVIDKVMAIVGNNIILQSDIEKQYYQAIMQGEDPGEATKCNIFDQLLVQKLLINQAAIDSVVVTDAQVDNELDKRMRYFIKQVGSQEKLEEYFHSTITQLKADLRVNIRDQLVVQTMQGKIMKDVTASPSDVRKFFKSIPEDSIPYIPAELEIEQIVKKPPVSAEEKKAVKARLEEFRKEIMNGKDFAVYAALYSEDKSSAKKGGELGFFERGTMVPEFEAVAFTLKPGEVSPVIETKFGYHILMLIERRGEQINVRHILLQPKISDADMIRTVDYLDSLKKKINAGLITFEDAAMKYSDDEETRNNGGLMVNQETGSTKLSPDKLDRILFFQVDTMPLNKASRPLLFTLPEGTQAYRIVMVKSRTTPHKANLTDDYQSIQEVALQHKQNNALTEWIEKKKKTTYIQINDDLGGCKELKDWTTIN